MAVTRATWMKLTDAQLLAQCQVDTYRASGPGGQKRNKTNSAVRLRHPASGLIVIAEESRSQHENRQRALRRLRQAFYLQVRDCLAPAELAPDRLARREEVRTARGVDGRFHLGPKDPRFWPAVGLVLDVLVAVEARVSQAAELLGTSTANVVELLRVNPKVWQQANILRARFGHKPLTG